MVKLPRKHSHPAGWFRESPCCVPCARRRHSRARR